jgi:prophage tail gpP-like protein
MSFVFRPAATVEIDGQSLTAAEAGLERLEIVLAAGAHGFAALELWPRSKFASAAPGAVLIVSLGDGETVLTGKVATVAKRASSLRIEALDATAPLSSTRISATFRDLSVADIVNNLAGEAGVGTDTVDGDLKLETYAVDTRRTLWRHLKDLAALTGADLSASSDGKLRFATPTGGAAKRRLRFGADLLEWRTVDRDQAPAPGFAAHGATSEGGSRAWHTLLPDPLGESPPWSRIFGALRSREAADTAIKAAQIRAARSKTPAWALTLGAPELRLGDVVEISGLDGGGISLPGVGDLGIGGAGGGTPYRATSIRHCFDGTSGFTTALELEGTGEDASLLGALGALAGGLA